MREKIARAVVAEIRRQTKGDWPINTWTEDEDYNDVMLVDAGLDMPALADAVLDTLMQPDEAMIEAGFGAVDPLDYANLMPGERYILIWRAMITAARSGA